MNTENKEVKGKSRQISGRVLELVGGLLILFGLFLGIEGIIAIPTEWYLLILICTVPCCLLGVPLLILGIRRIKNGRGNEIINTENIARKNKNQLVWGWVATIVGGFFMFLGIYYLLILIFGGFFDLYTGIPPCILPVLLFGIPLLILGVRRIKKIRGSEIMNLEIIGVNKKKHRIWGWILAVVGGLIIIISIGFLSFIFYVMYILSPLKGIVEPYKGFKLRTVIDILSLNILPLLLIGLSLLILGYIMLRKKVISRQSRGWILNIMGGIYIIAATLSLFYVAMTQYYQGEMGVTLVIWYPFLILGILGLVFGIRDVRHKEKTPPENLSGLDNPQDEVENGLQE